MSKLLVIDETRDLQVPFLRGMLTKSLQRSGLEFVEAYQLATDIREDLDDVDSITTNDLRERITEALAESFPDVVLTRYNAQNIFTESIQVINENGDGEPFSRGVFIKRLQNCGIAGDLCNEITREIHGDLMREGFAAVESRELIQRTYQVVSKIVDRKSANHYLIWADFNQSSVPLIIMIGGVPGSGKSTVATELANQLSIIRTQSTDMLREVMRSLIPKKVSPALHESSFAAGKSLHSSGFYKANLLDALTSGYHTQSDMVAVACQSVLNRAVSERVSMILEGVHIRPSLYKKMRKTDAVTVPVILAELEEKKLKRNFRGRSNIAAKRSAKRYLKYFDEIWQLQSIILSDADAEDIEIVENIDPITTVTDICKIVTETLATHYKGRITELQNKFDVKSRST
ncbi:MAG: zeta toxin family protein [Acidiferrobacterales bacterium]|nr:zeta toxin family protein [Acidiferrobacterales bacterium]